MEATNKPKEETLELIRLFHQAKKTLPIMSCNYLTDESVKLVLNIFVRYEPNYESPPFSINDAKDVTAHLINVATVVQNPEYHENPSKQEMWLRRFMRVQKVDYVKDS